MEHAIRFSVSLDPQLLEDFDRVLVRKRYETRSEAIRDLIRDKLVLENWEVKGETVGTVTIVYDHHLHDLTRKLTSLQHDYQKLILSTMHVHLDHDNCLEVLAVRGPGQRIREIADRLIGTRGVKHGKLTMTTTGKGLA
jgi:CopG family transcriptional regulator, nickel-responsive regulator